MDCYNINIIDSSNIDYFLFTKKKCDILLNSLKETLSIYYELREFNAGYFDVCNDENKITACHNNIAVLDKEITKYEKEIRATEEQIILISKNIQHNCVHEFIEDYVDVDPERSEKIVYCQVCEYTKI
jgi:hypothetical protein